MEEIVQEEQQKIGIFKVVKFGKTKQFSNEYAVEKSELLKIETDSNTTIVKIEFTLTSCIILLSNGKVLTRGKIQDVTLGREANIENVKKFKQIYFTEEKKSDENNQEIFIYNICAGEEHVLALDNDMRIWGWGKNDLKQIDPSSKVEEIKYPQLIKSPQDAKIIQIYTLNSTSLVVCRNNIIYMWGSNKEKFFGEALSKIDEKHSTEFIKIEKLTSSIAFEMRKNDKSQLEGFINSRKLFNSKFNITLEDNINKNFRIEKLNNQIFTLKNEIKKHNGMSNSVLGTKLKSSDKRIIILQDLLQNYENNLSNLTLQKESYRKELITIESDLHRKEIDMKGNTSQIDQVEDQIEQLNNEINSLKYKGKHDFEQGNTQELINDRIGKINNLNIYKDSLSTNLQIIINYLENKDKERYEKAKIISTLVAKENEYLKGKFVLEDMIQILYESTNYNNNQTEEVNDKYKDKYLEYFKFAEQIDNCSFLRLHKKFPFMIISDILAYSELNIISIKKEYDIHKQNLSENIKEHLNVILNMIETKFDLTQEQNNLIKCLYALFSNLESEIKKKTDELDKESIKFYTDNRGKHIEYIYKELVVSYLKEVYKQDDLPFILPTKDEIEKVSVEKEKYLKEKQEEVQILESRELIEQIDSKIDFDSLVCFDYES